MLEVDDDPVQADLAHHLCRSRRVEARPGTDQHLATEDTLPEAVNHVPMMPGLTHPLWPPVDLRLTTGVLELRIPREQELPAFAAVVEPKGSRRRARHRRVAG